MKELVNQLVVKDTLFVHLTDFRTERLVGELPDVVTKENFIIGKRDQRLGRRSNLGGSLGHKEDPFERLRET
jgi:hypothetical protein